ncbi:LOW QUALITY PROTEIN: mitochondrial amidoxime-reducing component 1 [Orycteropus afer afer]|uniref:LOW QUALITY PROTEIN: mitochondrial amidoxime-reducing component 1 n=1 Tax=Orycteropus afer afer TaxID=1230840 RepID=A0A8B6ZHP0_ORYAF|nr:LOW QUALITY PROTEIN: mitochondrial amidoxime-reducing component 1 [Orycteropus afer afer]
MMKFLEGPERMRLGRNVEARYYRFLKPAPASRPLRPAPQPSAVDTASSYALARLGLPVTRTPALPRPRWLGVAALGLATMALGAVAWRQARWRLRRLQQVGTVAQLWIYPVKFCKGMSVSATECIAMGLRSGQLRNGFWLVINKKGNMVIACQEPRLVLISLTCDGDSLTLSAAYTKDLQLPIKAVPTTNAVHKCRVHSLEIEGRDCGDAAAEWITSFLKTQPYRLVHFEPHMQPRRSHQLKDVFRPTEKISYPDTSPFLILSAASLADLNSRLEKKIKATNFRPNIAISGCHVYEEDTWDELLIGNVEMKKVMSCPRCVMTTVDPDTGVIDRKEPLETLKSYRLCDPSEKHIYKSSPLFGTYCLVEKIGTMRVGDPVYCIV